MAGAWSASSNGIRERGSRREPSASNLLPTACQDSSQSTASAHRNADPEPVGGMREVVRVQDESCRQKLATLGLPSRCARIIVARQRRRPRQVPTRRDATAATPHKPKHDTANARRSVHQPKYRNVAPAGARTYDAIQTGPGPVVPTGPVPCSGCCGQAVRQQREVARQTTASREGCWTLGPSTCPRRNVAPNTVAPIKP